MSYIAFNDASLFFEKWRQYLPEYSLARINFDRLKNSSEKLVNFDEIDMILENVVENSVTDAINMLLCANVGVVTAISGKMYDENGEENDYVPAGCTKEALEKLIIENGGSAEKFSARDKQNMVQKRKKYEAQIQTKTNQLASLLEGFQKIKTDLAIDELETKQRIVVRLTAWCSELRNLLNKERDKYKHEIKQQADEIDKKNSLFK